MEPCLHQHKAQQIERYCVDTAKWALDVLHFFIDGFRKCPVFNGMCALLGKALIAKVMIASEFDSKHWLFKANGTGVFVSSNVFTGIFELRRFDLLP